MGGAIMSPTAAPARPGSSLTLGVTMVLLLLAACRSSAPSANEVALAPGQAIDTIRTIRALMRVRATNGERTETFRAQLIVEPSTQRVELTAYTPVGTTAMTLFADNDRVTFLDHINHTAWQGSAQSLDFFAGAAPASWALAILGYPRSDVAVTYDAATRHASIAHGAEHVESTTLEAYGSDVSPREPAIPRDSQCCVAPKL
jgi:hypothetical protein